MSDLDAVGGVPVVLKELLDAGLLHGDCLTVTGKTVAENLQVRTISSSSSSLLACFNYCLPSTAVCPQLTRTVCRASPPLTR